MFKKITCSLGALSMLSTRVSGMKRPVDLNPEDLNPEDLNPEDLNQEDLNPEVNQEDLDFLDQALQEEWADALFGEVHVDDVPIVIEGAPLSTSQQESQEPCQPPQSKVPVLVKRHRRPKWAAGEIIYYDGFDFEWDVVSNNAGILNVRVKDPKYSEFGAQLIPSGSIKDYDTCAFGCRPSIFKKGDTVYNLMSKNNFKYTVKSTSLYTGKTDTPTTNGVSSRSDQRVTLHRYAPKQVGGKYAGKRLVESLQSEGDDLKRYSRRNPKRTRSWEKKTSGGC